MTIVVCRYWQDLAGQGCGRGSRRPLLLQVTLWLGPGSTAGLHPDLFGLTLLQHITDESGCHRRQCICSRKWCCVFLGIQYTSHVKAIKHSDDCVLQQHLFIECLRPRVGKKVVIIFKSVAFPTYLCLAILPASMSCGVAANESYNSNRF